MWVLSDPGRHPAEVHSSPGFKEGSKLVAMPPAGLFPIVATSGLSPGVADCESDPGGQQYRFLSRDSGYAPWTLLGGSTSQ